MAVAKSAVSSNISTATCSSATHTIVAANTLTVGASDTFLLMGIELDSTTPGTAAAHWDSGGSNQAMTSLGTIITEATSTAKALVLFGLVNPVAGNKTASHSFSGQSAAANGYSFLISFTGSETSSVAAATEGYATNSNSTGTTASVASGVSIPSGDMAVAFYVNINSFTNGFTPGANPGDGGVAIGQNQSLTTNASAEYYSGAGATITASAAQASGAWAAVIVGIKAPGGAAAQTLTFDPKWWEGSFETEIVSYG